MPRIGRVAHSALGETGGAVEIADSIIGSGDNANAFGQHFSRGKGCVYLHFIDADNVRNESGEG